MSWLARSLVYIYLYWSKHNNQLIILNFCIERGVFIWWIEIDYCMDYIWE